MQMLQKIEQLHSFFIQLLEKPVSQQMKGKQAHLLVFFLWRVMVLGNEVTPTVGNGLITSPLDHFEGRGQQRNLLDLLNVIDFLIGPFRIPHTDIS